METSKPFGVSETARPFLEDQKTFLDVSVKFGVTGARMIWSEDCSELPQAKKEII